MPKSAWEYKPVQPKHDPSNIEFDDISVMFGTGYGDKYTLNIDEDHIRNAYTALLDSGQPIDIKSITSMVVSLYVKEMLRCYEEELRPFILIDEVEEAVQKVLEKLSPLWIDEILKDPRYQEHLDPESE